MDTITAKDGITIYYKDWGKGQPIVFSHGWPLSADDWDTQMLFFLHHGYRVIAHDRRGHGRSRQTAHRHVETAIHVGHSGGAGEVVHYVAGRESRVPKPAVLSAARPLMVQTAG